MDFLGVHHIFMPTTNIIYNDNKACVQWLKHATTKGLRHICVKIMLGRIFKIILFPLIILMGYFYEGNEGFSTFCGIISMCPRL
jgi:hypothetical protein